MIYTEQMNNIISWIQIILSVLLIAVILLQQRGSSLGSSLGGDSATYTSRRGIERTLFNITIVIGILYFVFALIPIINR